MFVLQSNLYIHTSIYIYICTHIHILKYIYTYIYLFRWITLMVNIYDYIPLKLYILTQRTGLINSSIWTYLLGLDIFPMTFFLCQLYLVIRLLSLYLSLIYSSDLTIEAHFQRRFLKVCFWKLDYWLCPRLKKEE